MNTNSITDFLLRFVVRDGTQNRDNEAAEESKQIYRVLTVEMYRGQSRQTLAGESVGAGRAVGEEVAHGVAGGPGGVWSSGRGCWLQRCGGLVCRGGWSHWWPGPQVITGGKTNNNLKWSRTLKNTDKSFVKRLNRSHIPLQCSEIICQQVA